MQSLVGIVDTLIFGWIAARLGGVRTLALLVFDGTILWALLLLHPNFVVLAAIVGVIGLHGSGSLPVSSAALSELFGRESFSRVYGIFNLINLPFAVLSVPTAAMIYGRTGPYTDAALPHFVATQACGKNEQAMYNRTWRFCRWAASQGVAWLALSPFSFSGRHTRPSPYGFGTKTIP